MNIEITQITATNTEDGPVIFGMNLHQQMCEWNYVTGKWEVYSSESQD